MHIVMVITSYHPIVGGAEKQVAQLAGLMQGMGHRVTVLTRHHAGLARDEVIAGVRVRRIAAPGPKPVAALAFLLGATFAIRQERPDVIHCHSLFSPTLAGAFGKILTGAPLLAKPMCGGEATVVRAKRGGARRMAFFARHVDRFIAVSQEIRAELIGLGLPEARIRLIPNGVDLTRFHPAAPQDRQALRDRLGLPGGVLIVFAGRVATQKRLPQLLQAWQAVAPQVPDATLLIAGANRKTQGDAGISGENADHVPDALLAQPQVRLLGHVEDMPALLAAADAFVLPSDREGLSNALLEACASGLATLSARIGGAEDFVIPGENGLLFEPRDDAGMAQGLLRLAGDVALRARLGQNARATMAAGYDLRQTAARLIGEYTAPTRPAAKGDRA